MSTDPRVDVARHFSDTARQRRLRDMSAALLMHEVMQGRRLLRDLLGVVDEAVALAADDSTGTWLDGSATIAPADLATIRRALDLAASHDPGSAADYNRLNKLLGDAR